jgi:hypothetical protein
MSEFENMLAEQVKTGGMTQPQMDELLAQQALFDSNRQTIETTHHGQFVGYVNGQMLVDKSYNDLSAQAKKAHPGRLLYFEPVGFSLIG